MFPQRGLLFCLALLVAIPSAYGGVVTPNSPSAGFTRYQENFDGLLTGSAPADTWYTWGTLGTGTSQVSTAPAGLSGKAAEIIDGGVPWSTRLRNNAAHVDLCTTGQSVTFDIEAPDLANGDVREIRISAGATALTNAVAPANTFGLRLTGILGGTNTANFFARGNAAAASTGASGVQTPATVVHIQVSQVNCATRGCAIFTFTGLTALTSPFTQCAAIGDPFVGQFNALSVVDTASIAAATVWLDNYDWQGAQSPAPTVTAISPSSGSTLGGTSVTITGTGFVTGATVALGGSSATSVAFVSSTTLTATTAAHSPGAVNVVVTNPDTQTGTLVTGYTYTSAPTPTISSINPTSGPQSGGDTVTITGTNFANGATVTFGATAATSTTFVSSTHLETVTPPHAAGVVTLTVTNPDSTTATSSYTYTSGLPGETSSAASEDFDDDTVGLPPEENWYTVAQFVNAAVTSSSSVSAPNSLSFSTASVNLATAIDPCVSSWDFDMRVLTYATGGPTFVGFHNPSTVAFSYRPAVGLFINSAGTLEGVIETVSMDKRTPTITPSPTNAYHHYKMTLVSCASTPTLSVEVDAGAPFVTTLIDGSNGPLTGPMTYFGIQPIGGVGGNAVGNIDNINIPTGSGGPITATNSLAVTTLTGFDVDSAGQTGIIRYDNGNTVNTFAAGSLDPHSPTWESYCPDVTLEGVSALYNDGNNLVSFYQCDSNSPFDVAEIEIRDNNLEAPTFNDSCQLNDYCIIDIDLECGPPAGPSCGNLECNNTGSPPCDNTFRGLSDLQRLPYDYSDYDTSFLDSSYATWAISTTDGRLAILTYTSNLNADDAFGYVQTGRLDATGGSPKQLCTTSSGIGPPHSGRGIQGNPDLVYAFTDAGNVHGYKVEYEKNNDGSGTRSVTPFITAFANYGASSSGTKALSCADNKLLIGRDNGEVRLYAYGQPSVTIRPTNATTITPYGVTLDPVGIFGAYADSTRITLFRVTNNGTSSEPVAYLAVPAGTLVEMEMDILGQHLWVATSTGVFLYETAQYFETQDIQCDPQTDTDQDGSWNANDDDLDGDGINNNVDPDMDQDGIPNATDPDIDGDGCPNDVDPQPGGAQPGPIIGGSGGNFFLADDAPLPPGFTRATFLFLIGVLLMFAFTAAAFFAFGRTPMAAMIGAIVGFFASFAFGLLPIWIIVVLVVAAVAALFLTFRSGAAA